MEFTIRIDRKTVTIAAVAALLIGTLAACDDGKTSDSQSAGQKTTESYSRKLTNAQPYPLSLMNDSDERANLRERLLRFNNPNKIGYLAELTQNGQVLAYFTIKGKVSSTSSQLTPPQNINYDQGSGGGGNTTTESMGDDGSYGPEECSSLGVFFFDTNSVMHEWCGQWAYSDAPMNLRQPPLIVQSGDAKPSTSAGQIK
jgi:hypothetical protein